MADTLAVTQALHYFRPIGVLAYAEEIGCAVYDLVVAVTDFEPELPLLPATDNRASVRGAQLLWQLSGLIHLTRRQETSDLVEFLFRAGRRTGTGRLLPV